MRYLVLLTVLISCFAAPGPARARPKTDFVALRNGNTVNCEIKVLQRGKLQVKTDGMGTLDVTWADIDVLTSDFYFRVENRAGAYFFGTLNLPSGDSQLQVIGETGPVGLEMNDIVEIAPIERSFWSKLDGSLSFGFSYTKGSNVAQLTFDWANVYRAERNAVNIKANTIITDKGTNSGTTKRADFTTGYYRSLRHKWTGVLSASIQRNDELNILRRLIFGLGTGVSPVKNNRNVLVLTAGLALNSELGPDTTLTNESVEGVLAANYNLFKYDSPKTDVNASLQFFPSLTETDRYRLDLNLKFRREIVSDFFLDLSYYTNLDSKPPSGEGTKSDFGIVTSVGWSY